MKEFQNVIHFKGVHDTKIVDQRKVRCQKFSNKRCQPQVIPILKEVRDMKRNKKSRRRNEGEAKAKTNILG